MLQTITQRSSQASEEGREIQISQLISALSFVLDLTEGQPMGHAARSCMIGVIAV